MCTAITYQTCDHYFGRNLDLEYHYNEQITVTPRNFPFRFTNGKNLKRHHALIGMATIAQDYPLYYEATNEKGLSMAGLNFPGNAHYFPIADGKDNISPYEFMPWLLTQCATLQEARSMLQHINLCNIPFSEQFPLSPLHWLIADKTGAIVVESMQSGLHVHENPVGVLTNNPPFDYHRINMSNYMGLHVKAEDNHFRKDVPLHNYSLGMGALGLPGDFSSASRFVRAFFVKENSVADKTEKDSVNQFFHILNSVAMPKGCVWTKNGFEYTRYSSCCNMDKGIYYYKTYHNPEIIAVSMEDVDLNQSCLYPYEVSGME